ncbi:hypothetical protein FS837_011688 [Tulasnella sp. UAMH 9824]|nr:hypothetical protein FS837_011688 [Tulasnella sp. UAMH 9824]
MATHKVTFATPWPSEPVESSLAASVETLEDISLSLAKARVVLEGLAHLIIASERLTLVDCTESDGALCDVYFAKLDETSHTPKDVTVERYRVDPKVDGLSKAVDRLARQLEARNGLRHPNVLELLGYYLSPDYHTAQVISPYMINGRLGEYLARPGSCVGIDQRLRFKDADDPSGLTASFGLVGPWKYYPPEIVLDEHARPTPASDVWAWGCTAFERQPPAPPTQLLRLVPQANKREYASTLRLLHTWIPPCWEYEPSNRPSISLIRQQVFVSSFESDPRDSVVATLEELAYLLIPAERLSVAEQHSLGSGNYGEVFWGTLDEVSPVAVKRLKAGGTRGERVVLAKRLAKELNIWAKIKHPNVVELIGWYLDEKFESPLLISVLMPNGDVLEYIKRFKPGIDQRVSFVKGITAGLACLHDFDPPTCHADLKPANVVLDLHMNAVLCDFGLASFVSGSETAGGLVTSTTIKGTARYMSPELFLDTKECKHSLESDIWAWACTVFQVLTDCFPYPEASGERQICTAMIHEQSPCDVNLLLPNNFGEADYDAALVLELLCSTLPQCWDFHPQRRPSMRSLISQISDPSSAKVTTASRINDVSSDNSKDGGVPPEAPQNSSSKPVDSPGSTQGVGSVDVSSEPESKNMSKRKRGTLRASGDPEDNEDDRRVRARLAGGSDGGMQDEDDQEREVPLQPYTLKAQLLALVAAIDEASQMKGSQVSHENPIGIQGIRKALGNKWESQLATVLRDIDHHKKSGGGTKKPSNSEEGRAS